MSGTKKAAQKKRHRNSGIKKRHKKAAQKAA
jgi:hypothetical protein